MSDDLWRIWTDTGGTFTDCLARDPAGATHRAKVLSSSALRGVVEAWESPTRLRVRERWFPDGGAPADFARGFAFRLLDSGAEAGVARHDPSSGIVELDAPLEPGAPGAAFEVRAPWEAPVLAAHLVTRTPAGMPLPPIALRLATTRGTNALLERRGAPTVLFITEGFADLLAIGTQQRPDLFALRIVRPEPLYAAVVEVPERLAADGGVLRPLDVESLAAEADRLLAAGIDVATVALMHSYLRPEHERALAEFLRGRGFRHVSRSAELAPFIKIVPRAETAVVDAYLSPLVSDYVRGVEEAVVAPSSPVPGNARPSLHVMTSAGGLVRSGAFRPRDSLLSGPAGGVNGAAIAGRRSGFTRIIGFDMGGTSTDVARYDGDFEYVWEHRVGDARLVAPALAIESVAAGGGSVCTYDRQGLRVGPESAGARPGPACYGAGGPLTITDVNLLLGRLSPERFGIPIVPERAEAAADALIERIAAETGERPAREALLEGLLAIANERMGDAIRSVSLRRGYDPSEYALVAFGGAGGQNACGVADRLGMTSVLVPEDASLLSAFGMGHAAIERFAERQILETLESVADRLPALFAALEAEAIAGVAAEGVDRAAVTIRRRIATMRFVGQDTSLSVEYTEEAPLRDAFAERYVVLYGHTPEARPIEVESLRVVASAADESPLARETTNPLPLSRGGGGGRGEGATLPAWFDGAWRDVPVYERDGLRPGAPVVGPALIFERHSAIVVEGGWTAEADAAGAVLMRREGTGTAASAATPETVRLELFTNRFRAVAQEMGDMLERVSLSTNVKERLDFSCAVLDPDGMLVVNAPHIPVHLGALGICVRRLRETIAMEPGDVVVTNHPGFGGSHLPDVTVVTPVHTDDGTLLGYVASRAHHAEIGGTRPGSMPPAATTLAEEGVVIPPTYLLRAGEARWDEIRALLTEGPHPTRSVDDNLADLRAAVAAGRRGAEMLRALADAEGADAVRRYMDALQARAERLLRSSLSEIPDGVYTAEERLDDGSPLCVSISVSGDAAAIDFAGTAGVHPGNLNATPAIVQSAVIYVLRLLVREPLPLNEGLMRAVTLSVPPGILNPDFPDDPACCPAVVGGNVETSQQLVDTLLKALGLAACSQGTMNNVLWGTDRFGYYETVCGGTGATADGDGAFAVHSHMTNTRITDPEIVERRYPVRLERFAVRRGSGGAGVHRGGDGAIREFTFLEPMSLSLLTQHRTAGPYGLAGGQPGLAGRQRIVRADGREIALGSIDGTDVQPGDRLILETPGGGGWGDA